MSGYEFAGLAADTYLSVSSLPWGYTPILGMRVSKRVQLPTKNDPGLPNSYRSLADALNARRTLISFDLRGTRADVFRFANRFRVASAFGDVRLVGYSERTARAYSALFRIVVTWSAFEQYLKVTGITYADAEDLFTETERQHCRRRIIEADREGKFFQAVSERTTGSRLRQALTDCVAGQVDHIVPFLQSVRHSFVHGDLAPGANGAYPGVAQKLAKEACPLVLKAIERDFDRRVSAGLTANLS